MLIQENNPIFLQWLAAYGSHLEEVAQGTAENPAEFDAQGKDGSTGSNDRPEDI
jgi:hypothetical protein